MPRKAINIYNLYKAKFKILELDEPWRTLIGAAEQTGTWMVYGPPKNGKTRFCMDLVKMMTKFSRTIYDSVEEGLSATIRNAANGVRMEEVGTRFLLGDKWTIPELVEVLKKKHSPNFIVIDSVQFADLKFSEYKVLKETFPNKIFCYISHIQGREPEGQVAKRIWRDSNVIFRVEGFRAFPTTRYGGEGYYDIWPEKAEAYWGQTNNNQ